MNVGSIRARLGLTQEALARLIGVHPMTVSRWERGILGPNRHQRGMLAAFLAAAGGRGPRSAPGVAEDLAAILNQAFVDVSEVKGMKLSASNQLKGRIVDMDVGPVTSRIVLEIAPKVRIVSLITTASVKRLSLTIGRRAVAIIKATEVILGVT